MVLGAQKSADLSTYIIRIGDDIILTQCQMSDFFVSTY